jgi:hypothetical protein
MTFLWTPVLIPVLKNDIAILLSQAARSRLSRNRATSSSALDPAYSDLLK